MALPALIPLAVTAFSGSVSYISGKIASDVIFKAVCWTFLVFVVGVFLGFIEKVIAVGVTIYWIIANAFDFIENSGGVSGSVLNNFFGVVACSGVLAGINATKGLILSAIVFRILHFFAVRFIACIVFCYFGFQAAIGARLT
jgi:hypothetical protein